MPYEDLLHTFPLSCIVSYFKYTEISIASLCVEDLEAFYKDLNSKQFSSDLDTKNNITEACHYLISSGMNHAILSGWISSNPCDRINPLTGKIETLFSDFILEWLGHSTISTTANIYTHFDFSKKIKSANTIMGTFPAYLQEV